MEKTSANQRTYDLLSQRDGLTQTTTDERNMMIIKNRDFASIGSIASALRVLPHEIEATAERLKIAPAMRLNGVAYFDADQCKKLRKELGGPNE